MVKETRFFIKSNLFRRVSLKANFGNIAMHSFVWNYTFFRKLRIFQYFEILSKSDLVEMKQNLRIAGLHMMSLKFKLQNYWSSWDFTLMMYKSSWKLIFIQIFDLNGFLVLWYTTLEFLSFCMTRHLHDGLEGCHDGQKSDLFRRIWLSE